MSESLPINGSKEEIYSALLQQIEAVISGTDDLITGSSATMRASEV
jgi:hypothetical protein